MRCFLGGVDEVRRELYTYSGRERERASCVWGQDEKGGKEEEERQSQEERARGGGRRCSSGSGGERRGEE